MKRAMLIAGGTVGGLGAVLSVTPPQLSDNGLSTLAGASAATSLPASAAPTAAASDGASAAPVVTSKPSATASKKATLTKKKSTTSSSTTSSATTTAPTPTPTATPSKSMATTSGVSGTFTGDGINVGYGTVQVKITFSNGKITDAVAVSAPVGRNQRWSDFAVPNLRSQTLAAQSAAITGVSGASYTSYGWYKSLITALQKAGLPTGV